MVGRLAPDLQKAYVAVASRPRVTTSRASAARREDAVKAITLHQPWASLIACGLKTIETRDWPPARAVVGERIAIHAGKTFVRVPLGPRETEALCGMGHFPQGAIVCTARLAEVRKVTQNPRLRRWEPDYRYVLATSRISTLEHREIKIDSFGDFSLGRWLWMLTDIQRIEPPVPARGRQRLWEWCQHGGKAL